MSLDLCRDAAAANETQASPVRIVLLDRQRVLRQALRALLDAQGEFTVVGDTGELREALALVETLRPSVLLTDLYVSGDSSVRHIEEMHVRFPELAILVLTSVRGRGVAAEIRRAGGHGYLPSDDGSSALHLALREVAAGRWYCGEGPGRKVRGVRRRAAGAGGPPIYLTERQRRVLRGVALGEPARNIAARLGVSVRAIHQQRQRLCDALQLHSTADLTRYAAREGLTETGTSTQR